MHSTEDSQTTAHQTMTPERGAPEALGLTLAAAPGDLDPTIIEHRVTVARDVPEVWALWTTTAGITRWLVDSAHIELRLGGPFEVHFLADAPTGQRGSEGCRVLAFRPQRMLAFTWNAPPSFPEARGRHTWVVVELAPVEGGCAVTLSHLGWPRSGMAGAGRWVEVHAYFDRAWARVLDALAGHCGRLDASTTGA